MKIHDPTKLLEETILDAFLDLAVKARGVVRPYPQETGIDMRTVWAADGVPVCPDFGRLRRRCASRARLGRLCHMAGLYKPFGKQSRRVGLADEPIDIGERHEHRSCPDPND
jgi:hypothetical protein